MEQLPAYIYLTFILTALLTLLLAYKAVSSRKALIIITAWLAVQATVALTGFYTITNVLPPRFALLIVPPLIFIFALFITKKGRSFIDGMDAKALTLLHVVRIPVELVLYWLFLHKAIPQAMTFEGRNFDILSGLTAPLVYYFGFVKKVLGRKIIIAWNIACMLLLINVVGTALLSAPFPFQQLGFEQPAVALFYFPFIWLPCFIVPAVLFSHLAVIRKSIR